MILEIRVKEPLVEPSLYFVIPKKVILLLNSRKVDANELIKKIRKIEIKTRGLSQNIFAGEYHSAFKGRGVIFSEVREYLPGDDIRDIDWNVTSRYNKPFVKVYEEERELTVMLLIDVSGSRNFGAFGESKKERMAELAATLAFSSIQNNDKVGVIFFSDKVEKFIPPKKGKKHILLIIREIIDFTPESRGTDINVPLQFLTNVIKKRSTSFLISDFIDDHDYFKSMSVANRKHDLAAIQVYDKRDAEMPDVGLIRMKDLESGKDLWVDTSSKNVRKAYAKSWYERQQKLSSIVSRSGVDLASVTTDEDFVKALLGLFRRRAVAR